MSKTKLIVHLRFEGVVVDNGLNRGFEMAMNMRGKKSGSRSVLALLFSCLLVAGAAVPTTLFAQESEEAKEEGGLQDALSLLRAGNDAFEAGDFEKAYQDYSKAYELFPDSTIRYRLGQSAQELGRVREAIGHYEAYLKEGDDEQRLERIEEELLPGLRAELPAVLAVESEPEGATVVLIDGAQEVVLGTTPGEFEVGPGQVEVVLRLEGYGEERFEGAIEPDSKQEWSAELSEADEDEEAVAEIAVEQPVFSDDLEAPGEGANLSVLGWSTGGLGVALLATGGVLSFLQADATNSANNYDKRADGASREELESLKDKANAYYRGARGTYIAGGILTAAGVGILAIDLLKSDKEDAEGLSFEGGISPQGGFIGVRGRF